MASPPILPPIDKKRKTVGNTPTNTSPGEEQSTMAGINDPIEISDAVHSNVAELLSNCLNNSAFSDALSTLFIAIAGSLNRGHSVQTLTAIIEEAPVPPPDTTIPIGLKDLLKVNIHLQGQLLTKMKQYSDSELSADVPEELFDNFKSTRTLVTSWLRISHKLESKFIHKENKPTNLIKVGISYAQIISDKCYQENTDKQVQSFAARADESLWHRLTDKFAELQDTISGTFQPDDSSDLAFMWAKCYRAALKSVDPKAFAQLRSHRSSRGSMDRPRGRAGRSRTYTNRSRGSRHHYSESYDGRPNYRRDGHSNWDEESSGESFHSGNSFRSGTSSNRRFRQIY